MTQITLNPATIELVEMMNELKLKLFMKNSKLDELGADSPDAKVLKREIKNWEKRECSMAERLGNQIAYQYSLYNDGVK